MAPCHFDRVRVATGALAIVIGRAWHHVFETDAEAAWAR